MRLILSFVGFFILVGCATLSPRTADDVAAGTRVSTDPYAALTVYTSAPLSVEKVGTWFNAGFALASLQATQSKDGTDAGMLIYYNSQSWSFFSSALDLDQTAFTVTQIERAVQSDATVTERFLVHIPTDYLRKHTETGLNIKVYGSRGAIVVTLPGFYVQGFLRTAHIS